MLRFKVFGLLGVAILVGLAALPDSIQAVTSVINSTVDDGSNLRVTQDIGAVVEPVVQVTTDPNHDSYPTLLEAADGRLWTV